MPDPRYLARWAFPAKAADARHAWRVFEQNVYRLVNEDRAMALRWLRAVDDYLCWGEDYPLLVFDLATYAIVDGLSPEEWSPP